MKEISGSHYILHLFTNSTSQHLLLAALSPCECKLGFCSVLWRIYVERIYSSNKIEIWLVNTGQVKIYRVIGKSDSFKQVQIFAGTAIQKLTNTPLFFSYPYWRRWFIFHETHYYCIILSYYLQLFDLSFSPNSCS